MREIDDQNLIIDEGIVQQWNKILARRPEWRGVSLTSPSAGRFVLQGYLETKAQSESLSDYMAQNFNDLDLLEKRVVVEENEVGAMNSLLAEQGFSDVAVQMNAGELTLSGTIRAGRSGELDTLISQFKRNAAVRTVKNFVIELAKEASIVDLTDSYTVTGSSNRGGVVVNIVINGKILGRGDLLDGMTLTELKRDVIFLERDDVKYKIEYNK
ncbi:MAG: EscD/YscD/HrpQ family type III secretion system inner membrane ring protein [Oceanospirillaceae bacterium]|nr:EscD/YscD/HrpQ family type III secretion system inner membrane ring protein [Oceanospirillaceae bacterium]